MSLHEYQYRASCRRRYTSLRAVGISQRGRNDEHGRLIPYRDIQANPVSKIITIPMHGIGILKFHMSY
jgi:hypothetical protein